MPDLQTFFGEAIRRNVDVDRLDMRILAALRSDARQSARGLAKKLDRSPGAILERIARLEREGVIQGYLADVDLGRLGVGMAAIVGLQVAHDLQLLDMTKKILQIPECERLYIVTGDFDLLVHLRVRNHDHLSEILFGRLWKLGGFRHSQTMVVLHEASASRDSMPALLGNLLGEAPPKAAKADGRSSAKERSARRRSIGSIDGSGVMRARKKRPPPI